MPGASLYPFVVSTLTWESRPGQWNLTVGLKATYALAPGAGEPSLAAQTDGSHEDVFFEQVPHASLYSPSDFVPFKSRADILLVGQAHAPGGALVESLLVRLRLGDFSKALRVTGERAWVDTPLGPRPSAPRSFALMPLRYERAWRKGENAAGLPGGNTTRPPASIDVATEEGPAETPGFGPIAPSWRAQRDPRVRDALIWGQRIRTSPRQGPVPAGIDASVFNCAPRDQQVEGLVAGAPLVLDNLHARVPHLETRLPSVVPGVFHVDPTTGQPREVSTRIDTLWIDTDREVFVVTWRGVAGIAAETAGAGRVLVAATGRGQTVTFDEVAALVRAASSTPGDVPARPAAARPAPSRTAVIALVAAPAATPFPLAPPVATPEPGALPIAGAPWAGVPAASVPRPSKLLEGTLPLGASLPLPVLSAPAGVVPRKKAPSTIVLQKMTVDPGPAAPFPLAQPGASASAAPVEGAPWAGVAAAPVPRPDKHLEGTMPLGSSLAEAMAKAKAIIAGVPVAPPPVVAPPPMAPEAVSPVVAPAPLAPRPPSVPPPPPPPPVPPLAPAPAPGPVQVWRVDAPEPAPAPPPARPVPPPSGPDVRKQMYGDFTRKKT